MLSFPYSTNEHRAQSNRKQYKHCRPMNDYDGVAIECQHPADCPNRPDFPNTLLRPGEKFEETISFTFSCR